ncbi:MAG: M18 family aminopeptidase, partial [Actinomycetes bacterium]
DVQAWDVSAFDLQPAALIGKDPELLVSASLNNQVSCHAGVEALLARHAAGRGDLAVLALFDHEEVGSTTATGADGAWLPQVLERRALAAGDDRATWLEDLAGSQLLSADMAHAVHPNYPERHEPGHRVRLGGGPAVKHNENARYATTAAGAAAFVAACGSAGVAVQHYSHHGALPCGSTIGPLAAAGLAVDTVDVGAPMLSMHSAREVMAVADVAPTVDAFTAWWGAPTA